MSVKLNNLLDIEKYLLGELVYFNPRDELRLAVSGETPMPLGEWINGMDSFMFSGQVLTADRSGLPAYLAGAKSRFLDLYEKSDNLKDVLVTGYLNDNGGAYGNTDNRRKTSLVAMSFKDGEGNGLISLCGGENCSLSRLLLDRGGSILAAAGVVTLHHRRALLFFDEQMRDLPGERGIIGHAKGGNLATYIYINRPGDNVSAYCINAQPYCRTAMTREQKASLNSDRYEYIVHTKNAAGRPPHIPYVSRTVPLSRYVRARGLTSRGFSEVLFDELGNLEGDRVVRATRNRLKRIVCGDGADGRRGYEESLNVFRSQMNAIPNLPRLLNVGLEEIIITMDAEAGTLWLRDEDEAGEYIYPYLIKGPASDALYRLRLRRGNGVAARSAFESVPLLTHEAIESSDFVPGVDRSTGFRTKSMLTVPLRAGDAALGALQILNKRAGAFDERDLDLAAAMAECMSELFTRKGGSAVGVREFRLLRIYSGDDERELFSIEQNEYREVSTGSREAAAALRSLVLGDALSGVERYVFNRRIFDASMTDAFALLREHDISLIAPDNTGDFEWDEALYLLNKAMQKRPMLVVTDLSAVKADCEGAAALRGELKRLCREMTTTAVVIL